MRDDELLPPGCMKNPSLPLPRAITALSALSVLVLCTAALADEFPGYAKVENFDAVSGGNVADLQAAFKYTNNLPDSVTFVDSLYYSRSPGADTYGDRISGF